MSDPTARMLSYDELYGSDSQWADPAGPESPPKIGELKEDIEDPPDPGPATPRVRLLIQDPREVAVHPPRWLWRWWLVRGKVHLLVGRPGDGKTGSSR